MDFFTIPTFTFNVLYCFFLISHDRRRVLHVNVTRHPTSSWIVQQLPYESMPKFLIYDHDAKYGLEVPAAIRSMEITTVQTAIQSPWQNGVAERWVGSCRRELLDDVIALDERHLKRLLSDYVSYYHDDRTHLGLHKQTPGSRARSVVEVRFSLGDVWAGCITATTELPESVLNRRSLVLNGGSVTHCVNLKTQAQHRCLTQRSQPQFWALTSLEDAPFLVRFE
jgi:hypothetical protein